jgi:hypothetical protein
MLAMRFPRSILVATLTLVLSAWVSDCPWLTSPDAAMDCCQSMPCPSHGKSQDCCKIMPSLHPPFLQSQPLHHVSFLPTVVAVMPAFAEMSPADLPARIVSAHPDSPPSSAPPAISPLRI